MISLGKKSCKSKFQKTNQELSLKKTFKNKSKPFNRNITKVSKIDLKDRERG